MPRRQFVADLQAAQQDVLPAGILDLQPGEDDGQIQFIFARGSSDAPPGPVTITALIPELSEYPKSHEYMIFSGEEAPAEIANALQNVRRTSGKTVFEMLDIVSTTLSMLMTDHDGDTPMPDSQFGDDYGEDSEDEYVYGSDDDAFEIRNPTTTAIRPAQALQSRPVDRAFRARVRFDLIVAKHAGFKVGVLDHVLGGRNCFVTCSIRMTKLGISEEAMQAWQVEPNDYLILVIQYPNGYRTNEDLQGMDTHRVSSNVAMRVCTSKKYKPTLQEAMKVFTSFKKTHVRDSGAGLETITVDEGIESSMHDTFISKPLNGLLNERLLPILRFRATGMGWKGAEEYYQAQCTAGLAKSDAVNDAYFKPEPANDALPDIVNADHYISRSVSEPSFPLLAMQFLLRHFVRCTEFCLVCHRKMSTELEAIKPYVCESELCLYQYMALGFGPSIEHEILAQPYVVDLLVSFCYNSASARKLKELPDGLSLVVPPVENGSSTGSNNPCEDSLWQPPKGPPVPGQPAQPVQGQDATSIFEVGYDHERSEIIFFDKPAECPVRKGDWIVMKTTGTLEQSELHCRVSDVTFYPSIGLGSPVILRKGGNGVTQLPSAQGVNGDGIDQVKPATPVATPKWVTATFQIYSQEFKSLSHTEKCISINKLLDTLPDVKAMQSYLLKRQPADLKSWIDRISPSALSLLRWIIASNRACIMQVDGDTDSRGAAMREERLYGMKDHMQFRFAMGAPDKEQRFVSEVKKTAERLKLQHPTLFAWHGSPLHNWHMIIREGLHFKNTDHGRAFGHGCYHSPDANVSTGYSGYYHGPNANINGMWHNSVLRISSALALNEIVNAPAEFVSHSPHYVVAQLDWIQTRYLLVQCAPCIDGVRIGYNIMPKNAFTQDPKRIPRGNSNGENIVIPAAAIKSRLFKDEKRPATPIKQSPLKKLKALGGPKKPASVDIQHDVENDDADSVVTDVEDLDILLGDDDDVPGEPEQAKTQQPVMPKGPKTDFIPGSLDFSKLPLMPMPTYATSATTKRLMKELQGVAKTQEATPLAELGWYIDVDKIDNVYQWIVELHSFHTFEIKGKPLPLAADMKKKDVTSIVLEMRFNKDYPFTPPYVRVLRPRFLGFNQGGGGHIVLGGAMCMELLTNTGWSSVSSIESVLMQIRLAIASEPFARLDMGTKGGDYSTGEAADGYIRACQTHGWQVPPGFKEMAYGGASGLQ